MALSKIKSKNAARRLQARIDAWEKMSASQKTGKSGKPSFTKPGSNRR